MPQTTLEDSRWAFQNAANTIRSIIDSSVETHLLNLPIFKQKKGEVHLSPKQIEKLGAT